MMYSEQVVDIGFIQWIKVWRQINHVDDHVVFMNSLMPWHLLAYSIIKMPILACPIHYLAAKYCICLFFIMMWLRVHHWSAGAIR